jgi:hypothetical protein
MTQHISRTKQDSWSEVARRWPKQVQTLTGAVRPALVLSKLLTAFHVSLSRTTQAQQYPLHLTS